MDQQFERVNLEEKKHFKPKRFQNKNNYENKKRFRNNRDNRDQQFQRKRQNNWKNNNDQKLQQQRYFKPKTTGLKRREEKQRKFQLQKKNSRFLQPNVIIKGLDSQMTDANLQKACKDFGPMEMCKLDRDNFGQVKPEGIGLVRFTNKEDAIQCVQRLDGATVKLFGEDSGEKVISASFVGDKNEGSSRGVLQITKGPIKKREWRR